ncbi:MAG: branched-chain amino acid ABC transporter substrate-binding protein [Desulfobacteraceae bacterium]|nr:MAG: branched-chain amino acid ABC transporter substrate-binding protein [Desulfobacteraceae bacterium]
MSKRFLTIVVMVFLSSGLTLSFCSRPSPLPTVKIGLNAPLTGASSQIGASVICAAQLWAEETNAAGGIAWGDKKYPLELIIVDSKSNAATAVEINTKLITLDEVILIVGPPDSNEALPAGEEANKRKTPMISPRSDNPALTRDRPYLFRACLLHSAQGPLCAHFIKSEFAFTKAAVLYDIADEGSKSIAETFRQAWEQSDNPGSVVADEHFIAKDTDFSSPLIKIVHSEAEVLFIPQHPDQTARIVQQARQLGWQKPIVGTHDLHSGDWVRACGGDCRGLFFITPFVAPGAIGVAKDFIEKYKTKYGVEPDEVAALTWDSLGLSQQALRECGRPSEDPAKNRQCLRDALAKIKEYPGITGRISFKGTGDPVKCAVIAKINDQGAFEFFKPICPL